MAPHRRREHLSDAGRGHFRHRDVNHAQRGDHIDQLIEFEAARRDRIVEFNRARIPPFRHDAAAEPACVGHELFGANLKRPQETHAFCVSRTSLPHFPSRRLYKILHRVQFCADKCPIGPWCAAAATPSAPKSGRTRRNGGRTLAPIGCERQRIGGWQGCC
jgi:hypothetical protein